MVIKRKAGDAELRAVSGVAAMACRFHISEDEPDEVRICGISCAYRDIDPLIIFCKSPLQRQRAERTLRKP